MGGYAALLHGGFLADAVLAFGPQSVMHTATLRPSSVDGLQGLKKLTQNVQDSVRAAVARGARMEVHAASDTHLEHALALPLADMALTIHPLVPRMPFGRLLDRVGILWPIVANAVGTLQKAAPERGSPPAGDDPRVAFARWIKDGYVVHEATHSEILDYLYGSGAPQLPRPGDWYCVQCSKRNMKTNFWCNECGRGCRSSEEWASVPTMADFGTRRVFDKGPPRAGDWGCGKCGSANAGRDRRCSCGNPQNDPRNAIV
jgi:hypothetical protein